MKRAIVSTVESDSRVHKVLLIINQTLALLLLLLCIIYAPMSHWIWSEFLFILCWLCLSRCCDYFDIFFCCCFCYAVTGCCFWAVDDDVGRRKRKSAETLFLLSNYPIVLVSQRLWLWLGNWKVVRKKWVWVPHVITYTTKEIHLSVDNWVVKNFIIGVIIFYRNFSLHFGELVERDNRRSASESTSKTTQTIHFFFIVSRSHQADEATLPYTPEKILHVFLLLWCFSDIFTYTQFELLGAEWTHSRKLEECSSVSILQQDRGERARSFK